MTFRLQSIAARFLLTMAATATVVVFQVVELVTGPAE